MAEFQEQDESSTNFWTSFTTSISDIRKTLQTLAPDVADDLETVQKLKLQLSSLQTYATESTPLLPAYDVRRSQEELEILGREIKDTELLLKPKKKFSFASRSSGAKAPATVKITENLEKKEEKEDRDREESGLPAGSYKVSNRKNETIFLSRAELKLISVHGASVQLLLKDCEGVTVSSPTIHGSVRLENMRDCQIFLGPCCTSVYLEECSNTTIFLSCHQLRIHRSHGCRLYVRANSHPIIEDCSGFGFAPYSVSYADIEQDFKESRLVDATCWDNVVDFRWHRNTPSPHWSVIPPSERIAILPPDIVQAGWSIISSESRILNDNGEIEAERKEGDGNRDSQGEEEGRGVGDKGVLGSDPAVAVECEEEEL